MPSCSHAVSLRRSIGEALHLLQKRSNLLQFIDDRKHAGLRLDGLQLHTTEHPPLYQYQWAILTSITTMRNTADMCKVV